MKSLATFWANFFTNSSGHPAPLHLHSGGHTENALVRLLSEPSKKAEREREGKKDKSDIKNIWKSANFIHLSPF
jgi:hypothetical protein